MSWPQAVGLGIVLAALACASPRNEEPGIGPNPDVPATTPPSNPMATGTGGTPGSMPGSPGKPDAAVPADAPVSTAGGPDADPGTCTAGLRPCPDRTCRPNDVTACGPSCTVCPAPANGRATCNQTACGVECTAGFIKCDGQCLPATPDLCCFDRLCPDLVRGTPACVDHKCTFQCDPDYRLCEPRACVLNSIPSCCGADPTLDTDGNSVPDCSEGVVANPQFTTDYKPWNTGGNADFEWTRMDGRGMPGSGSMKITNVAEGTGPDASGMDGADVLLRAGVTYTITADYYIPAGQPTTGHAEITLNAGGAEGFVNRPLGRAVGSWSRGRATVTVGAADTNSFVGLRAARETGAGPFTVYFDNILVHP